MQIFYIHNIMIKPWNHVHWCFEESLNMNSKKINKITLTAKKPQKLLFQKDD